MKSRYGMENWWVQEEEDGSNVLRGNITHRSTFFGGEPVLNMEASYTSIIVGYDTEQDVIETANSFYKLGEPIAEEVLAGNMQEAESLRIQLGGKAEDGSKVWKLQV